MARMLVVEDDDATSMLIARWLEQAHYTVDRASSIAEMMARVGGEQYDAVILDLHLADGNAFLMIEPLIQLRLNMRIIVLTANGSIDLAVEALRKGAAGFITKPASSARLLQEIHRLVPPSVVLSSDNVSNLGMIGESQAMRKIFELIHRIKDVDSTVLIQGETGTGKEVVARALHQLSRRCNERFEAINCAAIPEALLEGELFGYMKGAFTDARQDRKGLFEVCTNGTLFLDEMGEMPISLQAKLLRALQEHEIMPLGSQRSVRINTRIVAATNRSLPQDVAAGRFRADLYYRLSVIELLLPPLRERIEDIQPLCESFLKTFCARFGKDLQPLSPEILARMALYRWPGNIRELQNALERAVVLANNDFLTIDDIFPRGMQQSTKSARGGAVAFDPLRPIGSLGDERVLFEIHYLKQLLTMTKGNMSQAAQKAGKFRADLYRLLSKYEIDPAAFRTKKLGAGEMRDSH